MTIRPALIVVLVGAAFLNISVAAPEPIQQPAAVQVQCEVIEIWAAHGKAQIDPSIPKQLASRLTNNFKWTEYKQLSSKSKTLVKKRPESMALTKGNAVLTLIEIVDKAQVRLTVDFSAAKGKATATQLLAAGDWITLAANQSKAANPEAHLLAVSCK